MMDRLKKSLAEANERTRYALVVLLAIIAFLAVDQLGQYAGNAVERYATARENLNRVGGEQLSEVWLARAAETTALQETWRGRLWQGETAGVVAAQVQSRLIALAAEQQLERVQIEVDPASLELENYRAVRFTLSARADKTSDLLAFFAAAAKHEQLILFDELNIRVLMGDRATLSSAGVAPFVATPNPGS